MMLLIQDSSPQGNDGTVYGATHVHEHYEFDGDNDYIDVGMATSFNVSDKSNYTIVAWIYPTGSGMQSIVSKSQGGTPYPFRFERSGTSIHFTHYNGTNLQDVTIVNNEIVENEWQFVAVVVNDSKVTGYLNGVEKNSGSFNIINTANSNLKVMIGNRNGLDKDFNGSIDEVIIYNTSLSATDIQNLYNAGLYHTIDKGDAYIDGGVLDAGKNVEWIGMRCAATNDSYSNASCRMRPVNYSAIDLTDTGLVSYWTLNPEHINTSSSLADGLVSYWKFERNAEDSVGNNDGTLSGKPQVANGKVKYGYEFDGADDYVNVSDDDSLDPGTGDWTVAAWIKPSQLLTWKRIVSKEKDVSLTGWGMAVGEDSKLVAFYNDGTTNYQTASDGVTLTAGKWHFVTVVFDRTNGWIKRYVNGVNTGTNKDISDATGSVSTDLPLRIGARAKTPPEAFFDGKIDEVIIWNRSLSATEIKQIYDTTSGGKDKLGRNNGTVYGTETAAGLFKDDAALEFDGVDDYIEVPHSSDFENLTEGTITVWSKLDESHCVFTYKNKAGANKGDFSFGIHDTDKLVFAINNGSTEQTFFGNSVVDYTKWNFASLVWYQNSTNTIFKFYLNGQPDGEHTWVANLTPLNPDVLMQIGGGSFVYYGGDWDCNGIIDSVAIYNRTLSAQEIQDLYKTNLTKWSSWGLCDGEEKTIETYTSRYADYQCKLESSNTTSTPTLTEFALSYNDWSTKCTTANCEIVWSMNGTTSANESRYYYIYFDVLNSTLGGGKSPRTQDIMETSVNMTFINRVTASVLELWNEVWRVWK